MFHEHGFFHAVVWKFAHSFEQSAISVEDAKQDSDDNATDGSGRRRGRAVTHTDPLAIYEWYHGLFVNKTHVNTLFFHQQMHHFKISIQIHADEPMSLF